MSEDELAEVLAVSRKMLRKKSRQMILDMVQDQSGIGPSKGLPVWFQEDEKKHTQKIAMVTAEEVAVEKERIALLNNALPKKVWEAKQRKKKRLFDSLRKARSQSEQVFDNDAYSPNAKARQVRDIYKKALKKSKPKDKETIVGKYLYF